MGIFGKGKFAGKGLKYKLMLAFAIMSIIPLLATVYVISLYVFPHSEQLINSSAVVVFAIIIALLGLILARKLINPVIGMALEARIIANGEYDRKISVETDDEVGNIASSINSMTQKIRTNLDELKSYGQRMREINIEVHKKVIALSSLLQVGDHISSGSIQLESILELAVEKAASVFDNGYGVLYMPKDDGSDFIPKVLYNIERENLANLVVRRGGRGFADRALEERATVMCDSASKNVKEAEAFKAAYNLTSFILIPIYSGRTNLALLIIGSRVDGCKFKPDDVDLVKVFAKQITIAIESDVLSRRSKALAIKDELTDLFNKNFILSRLEEEIKRAIFYQRPCSFLVFNIDNFNKFRDDQGELPAEEALRRVAKVIKDSTAPVGKAARVGGDEFAMLLPEKNKREASAIAEDVRKKIESTNLLKDGNRALTVSAGVSENPIDGVTADELFKKAMDALKEAKSHGKNRVAV